MYSHHRRRRRRQRRGLAAALILVTLAVLLPFAISGITGSKSTQPGAEEGSRATTPETSSIDAPSTVGEEIEPVKAIYLTAHSAGSPNLDLYLDLIDRTELNAVVIDVKDVTGEVMYPSDVPLAQQIGATREVLPDLESLVAKLKQHDIYAIARVAVFEDDILPRERPDLAITDNSTGEPWVNYAGVAWADAYDRDVWEYNVAIAKEAAEARFDEIQFDYVRFPSDGPMERIQYEEETYPTKGDALAAFLDYAQGELRPQGARVAADVFGLAATEPGAGVGQVVDKLAPHLDVISPMAYPSHYPAGSYGYQDPNSKPYNVLENTMKDFEKLTRAENPDLEIRPWIQDFDLGTPPYGPEEIKSQMQAIYDTGETGWMLWNPANDYTEGALEPAP